MLLNLKLLNESLENKYKLDEAFDESMPKWLGDRLGYENLFYNKRDMNKAVDKYGDQARSYYKQNRKTNEYGGELSLINQFLKHGIDLSKVKVTEAPVPDKVPRITKKNQIIPIFLFDNGQIWAKGINDREEANWYYNGLNFPRVPSDDIIKHAVKYAFIELSDPNIDTVTEKRTLRKEIADELAKIPNYNRLDPSMSSRYNKLDKSGYKVTATADKYASKLRELKYDRLGDEIEKAAYAIEDMKHQISEVLEDIDLTSSDSLDLYRKIYSAVDTLRDAASQYKDACEYIEQMGDNPDPHTKARYADWVLSCLDRCNSYVKRVEDQYIGSLMKVVADW